MVPPSGESQLNPCSPPVLDLSDKLEELLDNLVDVVKAGFLCKLKLFPGLLRFMPRWKFFGMVCTRADVVDVEFIIVLLELPL